MKRFLVPAVLCAAFLSACSSAPGLGDYGAREAAETPPPRYAKIAPDAGFCRGVAKHDVEASAFDEATRNRVFANSLRQCVVVYAVNDTGLRVADMGGGTSSY